MALNLERFDLSHWLIHFTRRLDLESDDAPRGLLPEWSIGEVVEGTVLSPFFLLRRILRKRQILSSWSVRSGKRTIYGPHPAVCFSEMPLAAFLETSRARKARGENISNYALLVPKGQAFAAGTRPVIYGISQMANATFAPNGTRLLPANVLPPLEQYRYVAFDPTKGGWLDWSHEREWRWANRDAVPFYEYGDPEPGREEEYQLWMEARTRDRADVDGLCLDHGQFNGAGFLVQSSKQARFLLHDILRMVDAEMIPPTLFTFVLRGEELHTRDDLQNPAAVRDAIANATVSLAPFYSMPDEEAKGIEQHFNSVVAKVIASNPIKGRREGELGGCWLWLSDNSHPLTRALLKTERIRITQDGKYLCFLAELDDDLGLTHRETLIKLIAQQVEKVFSTKAFYYSVLMSDDINGVPSYTDGAFADDIHHNYAHHEEDF
jgi:hypothetical protein